MIAVIHPGPLSGQVTAPVSKSAAHRALICAALADAPCRVRLSSLNEDLSATMACLTALGARFEAVNDEGELAVTPIPRPLPGTEIALDCGESGSTLRFMLPIACALGAKARFIGRGRLPLRPNAALTDALRAHGAMIDADLLPMNASGQLTGGTFTLPGNVSSQYITGLLLALPLLADDSEILLTTPLESAAYVEMTLRTLTDFGIAIEKTASGWRIPGGQVFRAPADGAIVEGDWSAAAFWLAANAMGSHVEVRGLRQDSAQGDRAARELLGQPLIRAEHVPDLVPALAAAAAALPQRTQIAGAARLRLKESDRLAAVEAMIRALGGHAWATEDGLIIEGGAPLSGGTVDGCNDHRIVMAAAVLATRATGPVRITDAEAVAKSYPDFFRDYQRLGGNVHVEPAGN